MVFKSQMLRSISWLQTAVLCSGLMLVVGCDGCVQTPGPQQANEIPVDPESPRFLPFDPEENVVYTKPGHWMAARQKIKSKTNASLVVSAQPVDRKITPLVVPNSSQVMDFERNVALAQGQTKTSEFLFYVAPAPEVMDSFGEVSRNVSFRMRYAEKGLGNVLNEQVFPSTSLNPEQYFWVVLSSNPSSHAFWGGLNCMIWPTDIRLGDDEKVVHHRVVNVAESMAANCLPDDIGLWTSTSQLVWYDARVESLTAAQISSLKDWVAFGGVLVFSGPDALAALNDPAWAEISPVESLSTGVLDKDLADSFSNRFAVEEDQLFIPRERQIPWLDIELKPSARWVAGCDEILAERPFGRGRVVMSTISLSDDLLVRWKSYGSFVHSAIMRKPARKWRVENFAGDMVFTGRYAGAEKEPELATGFRLLSRDIQSRKGRDPNEKVSFETGDLLRGDEVVSSQAVSVWTDTSCVASAAVSSLNRASGISVPKISSIVWLLSGYLLVLVPLNWLFFRLIGRVEFAWLAAPVIALSGAVVVARSVQLDVGFSRSENRLGFIEIAAGHDRAYLTSYINLYTSLTTGYDAKYRDSAGYVLPVGRGMIQQNQSVPLETVRYQTASVDGNGIENYVVRSNTTRALHAESMIDLGGRIASQSLSSGQFEIENGSQLNLTNVAIIGFDNGERWNVGWIGDLPSGASAEVTCKFRAGTREVEEWNSNELTNIGSLRIEPGGNAVRDVDTEQLTAGGMLGDLLRSLDFTLDEYVMIGVTKTPISTIEILPEASQREELSVVLMPITYPKLRSPVPDQSLPKLVKQPPVEQP